MESELGLTCLRLFVQNVRGGPSAAAEGRDPTRRPRASPSAAGSRRPRRAEGRGDAPGAHGPVRDRIDVEGVAGA